MTWLYAASLVLGMLGLILWALRQAPQEGHLQTGSNARGPQVIAGAVAFGMGGMSASYAGWGPWPAAGAAVVAAGLGVLLVRSRSFSGDQDRD